VQFLQARVGAIQLSCVGRREQQHLPVDDLHAHLGSGGDLIGLVGLACSQLGRHHRTIVLAGDHRRLEVVGHGQHGDQRYTGVGLITPHPASQLGVGPTPLQHRIAADQLDFVEQHHPPGVTGRGEQAGGEAQPLPSELTRGHGREGEARLARLSQATAQIGDANRVPRPEPDDRLGQLPVAGAEPAEQQQRRGEPLAELG
jgi:hypothetical protein